MLDTNCLQTFKTFKELVKLSNWQKFWIFGCNIRGEISFQNLHDFSVAKELMSLYVLCKILSF